MDIRLSGVVRVVGSRDGTPIKTIQVPNLVVNTGKQLLGDLLRNAAGYDTGLTYCALGTAGTAAPATSNTVLAAEVVRKLIGAKTRASNVVTFETFFPSTECAYVINEVGHFGHTTAGTAPNSGQMFQRSTVLFDNSGTVYDITLQYDLTIG